MINFARVAFAITLSWVTASQSGAQSFRVETTPAGYSWVDMNDHAELAGHYRQGNRYYSVRFREGMVEQLEIPGDSIQAKKINNSGVVAGYREDSDGLNGFIFQDEYRLFDLRGEVADLNDSNAVLGGNSLWRDGVLTEIPPATLPHFSMSAMNNHEAAVGMEHNDEISRLNGIYWSRNTGSFVLEAGNRGLDINDSGYILMTNGRVLFNGALHQSLGGIGVSINNHNHVVGQIIDDPAIWRGNGPELLNPLLTTSGWSVSEVSDLNNAGQILAWARFEGGTEQTVILTPVPEPSSLVALGLLSLFALSRRKRS